MCRVSSVESELVDVSRSIRRFFLDSGQFNPSYLLIVTWDRVGPYRNGTKQVCADVLNIEAYVISYSFYRTHFS